jgi:hypothetical protein
VFAVSLGCPQLSNLKHKGDEEHTAQQDANRAKVGSKRFGMTI